MCLCFVLLKKVSYVWPSFGKKALFLEQTIFSSFLLHKQLGSVNQHGNVFLQQKQEEKVLLNRFLHHN